MLDFAKILADGGLLTLGFVGLVLAITFYNPRLWLNPRDVPPDIYAAVPPKNPREELVSRLLLGPIFLLLIVPPFVSTLGFAASGERSLFLLAAHAFLVLLMPTLGDLLIVDWLLLNTITPAFIVFPGTEGLPGYKDYGFHLRAHLKLLPMQVMGALVMALVGWWLTM